MTVLAHDPEALARARASMVEIADHLAALDRYVRAEVCGRDGFTGLLTPLGEVLDDVAVAVGDAAAAWCERWDLVTDQVVVVGRDLEETDHSAAAVLARIGVVS